MDLDDTTGVHHVALRKASLRTTLSLTKLSNRNFSSHFVEFSNGEMTAVARANSATITSKREARTVCTWVASNQPWVARPSVPISRESIPKGAASAPAGSDSSITGLGRIVGQQAAGDQSTISTFCQSIIHIVPRHATGSPSIEAKVSGASAQAQEPVEAPVDVETSGISSTSRRSSVGSQGDKTPTSTVPTSPASSTFSTLPFWRSALANLAKIPIVSGKPNCVIKALALEDSKHDDPEKPDDQEQSVICRLSWGLRISHRQFVHWDKIQDGESPCLEDGFAPWTGLAMTGEGQIVVAEDVSEKVQSSSTSPQLISEPFDAFSSSNVNTRSPNRCGEIVDVLSLELSRQPGMPSHNLDLAPDSKGMQPDKQYIRKCEHTSQVFEETGNETFADQFSEDLDIAPMAGATQDSAKSSGSPNIDKMIEELFDDENDGFTFTTPIVNIPRAPPMISIAPVSSIKIMTQSLKGTTASVPFRLSLSVPVEAIKEINNEFFRLWNGGVFGRCWIANQDEEEVQKLAVANVTRLYTGLSDDIVSIVKAFNKIVAELWEQGHPRRALVRGSQDDDLIHDLAARNLEWEYLGISLKNNTHQSTTSEPKVQPRKAIEAAPSAFEWYLQVLGGDDQYREHRSVKV